MDSALADARTQAVNVSRETKRIGGEISLGIDRVGNVMPWNRNWYAFSNGRAAIAHLLQGRILSISICAYTCPKFVSFLRRRDLEVRLYDVGEEPQRADWAVIPALFGSAPWCSYDGPTIIIEDRT